MSGYNPNKDKVAERTASQIERAKRMAVGGRKKRCVKGKSCSATCIAANKVCMVDLPWVAASQVSKAVSMVKSQKSALGAPLNVYKPASLGQGRFEGKDLKIEGQTFTPGKKLPGSTQPTLYVDKEGKGKWVVKEGGAPGQNVAEKAANDVYNILAPKLGSGGVDTRMIDGKLVNRFVENGKTLNSLSSADAAKFNIADRIRKSHIADALVANWDYLGLVNDNMMVDKGGKLVRIDSGGTFQYRAMGGDKKFGALPMETWTLRNGQGKDYWANAKDSDYKNLWTKQTRDVAASSGRLGKAINSSQLPQDVKTAFSQRVAAYTMANQAITNQKFNGKTISELADSGAISWKQVDAAMEKAFKQSSSFDANSKGWGKDVNSEIIKQLGLIVP